MDLRMFDATRCGDLFRVPTVSMVASNASYQILRLHYEIGVERGQVEDGFYVDMVMKPTSAWPSITEPGRVAYLGDSSHVTLLTHLEQNRGNAVHYLIPDNSRGTRSSRSNMDVAENQILAQRGAFLLPPRSISDELVESYFTWVHPIIPVINRARFMRQYRDPKNPPSVLLLQAVFLAGTHVYKATHNENATTEVSVFTFYKRAKALYDANYEDDRIVIVQSLVLLGWYQGGSAEAVESVCDWNRLAIVVAQGCGLHRCVGGSQLSHTDKSLRRRIWWTLFSRDRFTAMSFGRPPCINLEDSDVTMITEQDFVEHNSQRDSRYSLGPQQVQFYLQYVKLSQLAGIILSQHYSVATLLLPIIHVLEINSIRILAGTPALEVLYDCLSLASIDNLSNLNTFYSEYP
ncbi:cutinase transcription factor 1 alpha [Fusarium pseudocircinatum]|uniref:Cutinase transcription factor 1 alpha n=1 Tax=Fusarium pseudocircinatum TaxID=56676 RepID=A0A8H5KXX9_9HYPO|nr:cutinase transcription factor 1 alpha [Fusarium pseudocircinatum]